MKQWTITQQGTDLIFTHSRTSECYLYTLCEETLEHPVDAILNWIERNIDNERSDKAR